MCPSDTLKHLVANAQNRSVIKEKVLTGLCSARSVAETIHLPDTKRDLPLENVKLFNCDALILHVLRYPVKRGDVGSVINILAYWVQRHRKDAKYPGALTLTSNAWILDSDIFYCFRLQYRLPSFSQHYARLDLAVLEVPISRSCWLPFGISTAKSFPED